MSSQRSTSAGPFLVSMSLGDTTGIDEHSAELYPTDRQLLTTLSRVAAPLTVTVLDSLGLSEPSAQVIAPPAPGWPSGVDLANLKLPGVCSVTVTLSSVLLVRLVTMIW